MSKLFSLGGGARLLALIALTVVLLPSDDAEARRYGAIVVDAETGKVLHAERADRKAYPASLTKMMTLYMAFEALDVGKLKMNQPLKVSRRAAGMPASKLGLRAGRTILVKDAIMALVTKSANDVAVVMAEALGGTESEFARLMTKRARALGMKSTTFRNASGLPNKHQVSTARDMATLAQALMRHFPQRYKLFSTRSFTYKGRTYKNHNRLLRTYNGTDGIKTGYTHASGFNLVASAVRNGRRIIAVVFGGKTSRSRDRHIAKLMDRGFTKVMTASRQIKPLLQHPRRKPGQGTDATQLALAENAAAQGVVPMPTAPGPVIPGAGAALPALSPGQGTAEDLSRLGAGAPKAIQIPKRTRYKIAAAGKSRVPKPPAFAAIPERSDYDSAQGSADSPVPMPPPYDAIPRRGARSASDSSVAPGADGKATAGVTPLSWGIQVGAYSQSGPAQRAAAEAARRLPAVLSGTEVSISPAPSADGAIYRARLIGLDEAGARQACSQLERLKLSCYVVAPDARG